MAGQGEDGVDRFVPAGGHDVGGAEAPRDLRPLRMGGQRDDAFGARAGGGRHGAQPHRAIAHDHHGAAGARAGGHPAW